MNERARRIFPIAAVLALTAASIGASDAAERTFAPSRGPVAFNEPIRMESFSPVRTATAGENAGEPIIDVAPDGTVFLSAAAVLGAAAPVWYSRDEESFVEMESPAGAREWTIGAEGDFALDDQGRVYFVDTYLHGLLISRWSDNGDTWDFTIPAVGVPPGINDRPWLSWTTNGLFLYVNHGLDVRVYRSTDEGKTWTTSGPLSFAGTSDAQQYFPGYLSASRDGRTLVVAGMVNDFDDGGRAYLASTVSRDFGATWQDEAIFERFARRRVWTPYFPGVSDVDGRGNAYAVWGTHDHEDCYVWLSVLPAGGKQWREPVRVDRGDGCAVMPWVDVTRAGDVAVAWYESTGTVESSGMVGARLPGAGPVLEGVGWVRRGASPAARPTHWYVHAAMVRGADRPGPRILESRVAGPVLAGAEQRQLLDFLSVVVGPDGRLHVGFSKYPGEKEYLPGYPVADAYYVSSRTSFTDL